MIVAYAVPEAVAPIVERVRRIGAVSLVGDREIEVRDALIPFAVHLDEIPEEDMKLTGEKVTLGWFSEVTPENVYASYKTFVN